MTSQSFLVERPSARRPRAKLRLVRLHLAREPRHPTGSEVHGYAFVSPLDRHGMLDPSLWRKERARCRVVRFWAGEQALFGLLKHRAGGAGGSTWVFDFDPDRSDDDDTGHRLDAHRFRTNEYVTLEHEGEPHVFRVASVDDFAPEDRLAALTAPYPTSSRRTPSAA
ncbi:hypothetical protein [Methylopila sp. Yamaguchi]|uniref:hypothetical protein n=1 Tax=Methylopila sp. Yamaguchi TaxID=1437817 RepID=UPI000CA7BF2D|nr:hypothetical protein [Methylopila sp. Yamaguchi]GBD47815.1 hypothetical protein METY_1028 [Methylopila sp. Yamaguchi]